ncbi:hypothetical protein Lalb_Chr04g0248891 [Lupinus albus]|uniref:Uncharacterized protein n=1 Tax=Lupinus albus TaxID=3870 RepID=A0A6A4QN01_LUPAL|nr:hypothetical protein Lalb_Chr04g0248891 [Lupinus albus]
MLLRVGQNIHSRNIQAKPREQPPVCRAALVAPLLYATLKCFKGCFCGFAATKASSSPPLSSWSSLESPNSCEFEKLQPLSPEEDTSL